MELDYMIGIGVVQILVGIIFVAIMIGYNYTKVIEMIGHYREVKYYDNLKESEDNPPRWYDVEIDKFMKKIVISLLYALFFDFFILIGILGVINLNVVMVIICIIFIMSMVMVQ